MMATVPDYGDAPKASRPSVPDVPPTYLLMAAAVMHEQGKLFAEDMTEERVRKDLDKSPSGDVRMDYNEPSNKKFFEKLPPDMEIIDNTKDTGRGKGESIRLRYRKALTS